MLHRVTGVLVIASLMLGCKASGRGKANAALDGGSPQTVSSESMTAVRSDAGAATQARVGERAGDMPRADEPPTPSAQSNEEPPRYYESGPSADEICASVSSVALPKKARSSTPLPDEVRHGDSERYYYGLGVPVDYDRAFVLASREYERDPYGSVFGGSTMLMMLYANGRGVPAPNLDLAIRLACKLEGPPAEREGRVRHLGAMRSGSARGPFDVCDDVTSTNMEGFCESRDGALRAQEQARVLASRIRDWPEGQRLALKQLQDAAAAFWQLRGANEIDAPMFMGAAITSEEQVLRDGLHEALMRVMDGELPRAGEEEVRRSDDELNRVYRSLMSAKYEDTLLRPQGIRKTQRKWLAYRAAWVSFGAARYPEVDARAWETWVTLARTEQLKELLSAL